MRLIAIDLRGRDLELVGDRCWAAGAAGLWEVDEHTLRAGVDDGLVEAFVDAIADLDPVDVTDTEAHELAGRSATVGMAGHDVELWVPPTVFGDGHHPTTATCLRLLERRVRPGDRVLDVGCGSGALAICAALLGGRVTAIDLDPEAVAATAENAVRNGLAIDADRRQLAEIAGSSSAPYDLVVANMTSGALGPLVPDLLRATRAGGLLLVSGMLEDQWPAVHEAIGGAVADQVVADGWLTAAIRRR